jgi:tetrahydromethanopterin S-methyltransferase subunit A
MIKKQSLENLKTQIDIVDVLSVDDFDKYFRKI